MRRLGQTNEQVQLEEIKFKNQKLFFGFAFHNLNIKLITYHNVPVNSKTAHRPPPFLGKSRGI